MMLLATLAHTIKRRWDKIDRRGESFAVNNLLAIGNRSIYVLVMLDTTNEILFECVEDEGRLLVVATVAGADKPGVYDFGTTLSTPDGWRRPTWDEILEACDMAESNVVTCTHCNDEGVTYTGSYEHGPYAHEQACNYCQ